MTATLPPLVKQLEQQRDALTVLTGALPSNQIPEKFELTHLQLPQELPLSLPAKLVEQRPDVRQAEENLHFASAQIGVAVANRLPNLALTADMGKRGGGGRQSVLPRHRFLGSGLAVTQPIYEGGTLRHRENAAKARLRRGQRAIPQHGVDRLPECCRHLVRPATGRRSAEDRSRRQGRRPGITLDLTKKQLESGYTNYLSLLSAEQGYQQAEMNLVQAQGQIAMPMRLHCFRHWAEVGGTGLMCLRTNHEAGGRTTVSIIFVPAAANLLLSVVTIALGAFIAAWPRQAAKIWGSQRLAELAPETPSFVCPLVPCVRHPSVPDRRTPRGR